MTLKFSCYMRNHDDEEEEGVSVHVNMAAVSVSLPHWAYHSVLDSFVLYILQTPVRWA